MQHTITKREPTPAEARIRAYLELSDAERGLDVIVDTVFEGNDARNPGIRLESPDLRAVLELLEHLS